MTSEKSYRKSQRLKKVVRELAHRHANDAAPAESVLAALLNWNLNDISHGVALGRISLSEVPAMVESVIKSERNR